MRRNKLIYVSGKYTDDTKEKISRNIAIARKYAIALWEMGYGVICPHLNTAHLEEDCKIGYEDYIRADLEMVRRSDALFMIPDNWIDSKGAKRELDEAKRHNKRLFFSLEEIAEWHPEDDNL